MSLTRRLVEYWWLGVGIGLVVACFVLAVVLA